LAATAAGFDCHGPYFSFYNRHGPAMSTQRLDPALFPGQGSPHMHDFDGGNGLAVDTTFAGLQSSECTTARIKPDNSLYWRPALYWNGNGTGFYPVPNMFAKVYYKFGNGDGTKAKNISEFPEDFEMIAGDPFRRSDDGNNQAGVSWACIDAKYGRIEAQGFPKGFTSCSNGLATQLTFPACWNGKKMDPKNPNAHMAYPSNAGQGIESCPTGFQVARFPSIFIEFWYDVSQFDGQYSANDIPWVLAQGDPTGYGFHADFKNGWKKGVLAKATADDGYCNCGCGCGEDEMKQCFGAENVNDDNDAAFTQCSAKPALADERGVVQKLPGCNPIQKGPAEATAVTGAGCVAGATGGSGDSASAAPTSAATGASSPASAATSAPATTLSAVISTGSAPSSAPSSAPASSAPVASAEDAGGYSAAPVSSLSAPSQPSAASSDCSSAATVTVTPTVYVTAAADA
ncbi:uncharacterized protein EI97DRAFT_354426, partial [Westerdykella ornata]